MKKNLPRHPVLRKLARWILFGLISLVTLIVFAYSALSLWGRREWANAQAELRAKGEKLSLVELMPPAIPDSENFFAIPIWQELLELEPGTNRDGTPILKEKMKSQDYRIDRFRKALQISEANTLTSTLRGGYEKGAPRNFDAGAALYRDHQKAPPGLSASETILAALDEAKWELEEIQEAAPRPHANLGLPRNGNFFHLALPYLTPSVSLAQYLGMRIAAEAAAGRGIEAKANLFLLLRLADALQSDPIFISMLVRLSILSIATQAVWDGLEANCWSDSQLEEIQIRLGSIDLSHDLANGLRAERGGANQTLEAYAQKGGMAQYVRDAAMIANMSTNENRNDWETQLTLLGAKIYPRGLLFQSLAIYNRLIQEIIEKLGVDPFAPNLGESIQRQISDLQTFPNPFLYPLVGAAAPLLLSLQVRVANVENRLRQAQIAIVLERYRLAKGCYPEFLKELIPAYSAKLPTDVIDGENFRYRREAPDQFVLWSIGANRLDEGGTPPVRLNKLEEGDWVWRTASDSNRN